MSVYMIGIMVVRKGEMPGMLQQLGLPMGISFHRLMENYISSDRNNNVIGSKTNFFSFF